MTRSVVGRRPVFVALLRGINVGGKNRLLMKDLAALFEDAGCEEVRTYIQSGNVLFRATRKLAERLPERIAAGIAERHGLTVPVVMRDEGQLRSVVGDNPFASKDPKTVHVAFLAKRPTPARLAALDFRRSPPDEMDVRGREIYLCCPNGVARTKLTNKYFDSTLGTVSTIRTLRTVEKLIDLAGRDASG